MELVRDCLTTLLLALGCLVAVTGGVGMIRLPDFYSRGHAAGKTDSLAQVLIMTALLLQVPSHPALAMNAGPRLVMITVFILFTSPIATHAAAKAAHLSGLQPWTKDGGSRD